MDGKCIDKIDSRIGEIRELRLRVVLESKAWVILSDVSIDCLTQGFSNFFPDDPNLSIKI